MIDFHSYKIDVTDTSNFDQTIDLGLFSKAFEMNFSSDFTLKVEAAGLRFRNLTRTEFEQHIFHFLNFIYKEKTKSGPKRKSDWQNGWQQNLDEFLKNNFCTQKLIPHYLRRGQSIMRFKGQFIIPEDPMFENKFRELMLAAVLEKYLKDRKNLYEFAAGPCHNIVTLAENSNEKKFFAMDWVDSSQNIMRHINFQKNKLGLKSHSFVAKKFDFFNPDYSFEIEPGSVALTFGGLEQLGSNFHEVLKFFLLQKDVKFVHFEPFVELYDRSNLFGELGYRYASDRNYLNGYFSALKELESKGEIKVSREVPLMGSAFHDGWIYIDWHKI